MYSKTPLDWCENDINCDPEIFNREILRHLSFSGNGDIAEILQRECKSDYDLCKMEISSSKELNFILSEIDDMNGDSGIKLVLI